MAQDKPSLRVWTIEPAIDLNTGQSLGEASIAQQLVELLVDLSPVVSRIGGTLGVIADREEVEPEVFRTVRVVVRWESFAPARRLREAPKPAEAESFSAAEDPEGKGEPEPVEEPEPAAA